jgi:exodeoxyribonuclease VIII
MTDWATPADEPKPVRTFDHVMVDIETMSLSKHNALILSIGLREFDPDPIEGPVLGRSLLLVPVIAEQLLMGREVSKSTQKFWREQPKAASDHWMKCIEHWSLPGTISDVKDFIAQSGASRVWANGNQFDLANIEGLAEQLGIECPWHYRAPRDMRTYCEEHPATRLIPIGVGLDAIPHHPVSDCDTQIWKVWAHRSL